jgi:hypothetical protein
MIRNLIFILAIFFSLNAPAQFIGDLEDTEKFRAETKQVNQFFRRFNGEENEDGKRFYPGDRDYRGNSLRKSFLKMLFDHENPGLDRQMAKEFISEVVDRSDPAFLDFHEDDWFAQVNATFMYEGQDKQAVLFLKIEQEKLGYKWVISRIFFEPFLNYFIRDTTYTKKFLHPMSHELDFMNLKKAFADQDSVEQYVNKEFHPDYLTLFLYEIRKKRLSFITVKNVKFHFFQIDNWYFEVSDFNRPGMNTGWLISNLVRYKPEEKKLLRDFIFYEK